MQEEDGQRTPRSQWDDAADGADVIDSADGADGDDAAEWGRWGRRSRSRSPSESGFTLTRELMKRGYEAAGPDQRSRSQMGATAAASDLDQEREAERQAYLVDELMRAGWRRDAAGQLRRPDGPKDQELRQVRQAAREKTLKELRARVAKSKERARQEAAAIMAAGAAARDTWIANFRASAAAARAKAGEGEDAGERLRAAATALRAAAEAVAAAQAKRQRDEAEEPK